MDTPPKILSRLPWYRWTVVRLAAVVIATLTTGYVVSALFAISSIDTISKTAYDPEIEAVLTEHLRSLKDLHSLQQQLIVERLQTTARERGINLKVLTRFSLNRLVMHTQFGEVHAESRSGLMIPTTAKDIVVRPVTTTEKGLIEDAQNPFEWLGRSVLRVGPDFVLEFPRSPIYESYKSAESVQQRYQVVGAELQHNIKPALIKALSVTLSVSFLLLFSVFIYAALRSRTLVRKLIDGFAFWAESDDRYRFKGKWPGELQLITYYFNRMADEVEENRARHVFLEKIASWQIIARKLAHEIKNPLTPIQMMVSQVRRNYTGSDAKFSALLTEAESIITEEVGALRRMVDDFSQFARLPAPDKKLVNMVTVCKHVVELEKAAFPQHQILFSTAPESDDVPGMADEQLIRQVLKNLIKNAAEASGTTPARIELVLSATPQQLLLHVHDNGPGMPPDIQARAFEAYFTTKHTGPNPGMGLGLAVCQKIALDHGGDLRVESKPGDTVFTLTLPRV